MQNNKITLVGGGLVGSLLSLYLAKRGFQVDVFERRSDPREKWSATGALGEGRSINLAISTRGLHALSQLDLVDGIQSQAIPMFGRMLHLKNADMAYQQYGATGTESIHSISRGWLNCYLLDQAAKQPLVRFFFDQKLSHVDLESQQTVFENTKTGAKTSVSYQVLIGTDGSASMVREALTSQQQVAVSSSELSHGYKEFVMPADARGDYKIKKQALHIWPRGSMMMIALPNSDGSFTCTLFMAHAPMVDSPYSFQTLKRRTDVESFFKNEFPDFLELVPDCAEQFFSHPTGKMVTIKSQPWHFKDKVLLIGDAAHAIVPFFGQGMNCGFEDVVVLNQLLDTKKSLTEVFAEFFQQRKTNTDAIADMAVENFKEMAAKTADPEFLYQKKIEKILHEKFPQDYISRYSMVSFSRTPYRLAYEAGVVQSKILNLLTKNHFPSEDIQFEMAEKIIQQELKPIMSQIAQAMR